MNSSRLPITQEKSFEDIISEFNEKFQKIDERFDQLEINFNNYTNTEKPINVSENVTNKVIELNETILALRSENAQLLEKIRLLETKSPRYNDSNEQQKIYYQVPVSNTFSTLRKMENHEDTLVLTENSSSEGLQLGDWTKVTKKNPKKKENPQPKPTLSPTKSTPEVHQIKTPPINTSPSPIIPESSYQHPTNRKRKHFAVGNSHLKRLSKQLFNYSIRDTHAVIKNFDGATTKRLGHHVLPILKEDKPYSVLMHVGTNDVNNHNLYAVSPEKLASGIIEIGRTCKSFNVKEVFISSVLCRNEVILSNQFNCTNELLNKLYKENDFNYISNSNITPSHLSKDGIHLNDIGTFKLGDNLLSMSM